MPSKNTKSRLRRVQRELDAASGMRFSKDPTHVPRPKPAHTEVKAPVSAWKEARNMKHGGDPVSARAAGFAALMHNVAHPKKEFVSRDVRDLKSPVKHKTSLEKVEIKPEIQPIEIPAKSAPVFGATVGLPQSAAPVAISDIITNKGPKIGGQNAKAYHHFVNHKGQQRGVLRIVNREPVTAVPGTSAYTIQQFAANPSNPSLFPWLSVISAPMELFRFNRLSLLFYTEEASSNKGRIILNDDPDSTDSLPVSRLAAEVQQNTNVAASWRDVVHHVKIPPTKHVPWYFVGTPPAGTDPRLNNQTRLQVATVDCSDTGNNGELWVEYVIDLMTPTANLASIPSVNGAPAMYAVSGASCTGVVANATPGGAAALVSGSSSNYQYPSGLGSMFSNPTATSIQVTFALPSTPNGNNTYNIAPGSYMFFIYCSGTSVNTMSVLYGGAGVSLHSTSNTGGGSYNGTLAVNAAGTVGVGQHRIDSAGVAGSSSPPYLQYTLQAGSTTGILQINAYIVQLASSVSQLGAYRTGSLDSKGIFTSCDVSRVRAFDGITQTVLPRPTIKVDELPNLTPVNTPRLAPVIISDRKDEKRSRSVDAKLRFATASTVIGDNRGVVASQARTTVFVNRDLSTDSADESDKNFDTEKVISNNR